MKENLKNLLIQLSLQSISLDDAVEKLDYYFGEYYLVTKEYLDFYEKEYDRLLVSCLINEEHMRHNSLKAKLDIIKAIKEQNETQTISLTHKG